MTSVQNSTPQDNAVPSNAEHDVATTASAPAPKRDDRTSRTLGRLGAFWSDFRSQPMGLIGLAMLTLCVLAALLAPIMFPEDMLNVSKTNNPVNLPPGGEFPLGTDHRGISVLAQLAWGARASLLVGFAATAISMVIGTIFGMAAGHFHGFTQGVLMRIIDFFLVIPSLVLAITLSAIIGPGVLTIIIAIGVTGWASTARVVRSQTLMIETQAYIERARALGAGSTHILTRHVLPGVMPLVLAQTTLAVALAVISESTLAFLGLGNPAVPSWGSMLKGAMDSGAATAGFWWTVLSPGIAIVIAVLAFTLIGRALETVFNPALKGASK